MQDDRTLRLLGCWNGISFAVNLEEHPVDVDCANHSRVDVAADHDRQIVDNGHAVDAALVKNFRHNQAYAFRQRHRLPRHAVLHNAHGRFGGSCDIQGYKPCRLSARS